MLVLLVFIIQHLVNMLLFIVALKKGRGIIKLKDIYVNEGNNEKTF
jgi:hypothetical protein